MEGPCATALLRLELTQANKQPVFPSIPRYLQVSRMPQNPSVFPCILQVLSTDQMSSSTSGYNSA